MRHGRSLLLSRNWQHWARDTESERWHQRGSKRGGSEWRMIVLAWVEGILHWIYVHSWIGWCICWFTDVCTWPLHGSCISASIRERVCAQLWFLPCMCLWAFQNWTESSAVAAAAVLIPLHSWTSHLIKKKTRGWGWEKNAGTQSSKHPCSQGSKTTKPTLDFPLGLVWNNCFGITYISACTN